MRLKHYTNEKSNMSDQQEKDVKTPDVKEARIVDYVGYEFGRFLLSVAAMVFVSVVITGILNDKLTHPIVYVLVELIVAIPCMYKGYKLIAKSTTKG